MVLKKREIILFLSYSAWVNITAAAVLTGRALQQTTTGPVPSNGSIKNASVCWTDDVTYNDRDIVPGAGPCEQCVCNAPNIVCSMIKCEVKTGCKIIQQANQCCPDYKCDCEYNGQTYDNGAKIDTPDTPCRVCYCKGGDVMCTAVGCYEREDCGGKIVPGTCCPKYDHCPPLDPDNPKNRAKFTTTNTVTIRNGKHGSQPWLLTTDSVHAANAFGEITTIPEELDHTTETIHLSDGMITMVLKRVNESEPPTSLPTTLPTFVDTSRGLEMPETSKTSTVNETTNVKKVTQAVTSSTTITSSSEIPEDRTESITSLTTNDGDFSTNESNENAARMSIYELPDSKEIKESSTTEVGTFRPGNSTTLNTTPSSGTLEPSGVRLSTTVLPTQEKELPTVTGQNHSSPNSSDKLIEGAVLTIKTTVYQLDERIGNLTEEKEKAEVQFVEKGSNLSSILNSSKNPLFTTNSVLNASLEQMENNVTSSFDDEDSTDSTVMEEGSRKNYSLFVDMRGLNTIEPSSESSIMSTTVPGEEDKLDIVTEMNDTFEIPKQNTSSISDDMNIAFKNISEVEVFVSPVSNVTHENETVAVTEATTKNEAERKDAELANINMTQAFSFTYNQLLSATEASNCTECTLEITELTLPLHKELNVSTTTASTLTNSTITTAESSSSEGITPLSVKSAERVSVNLTSAETTETLNTQVQNTSSTEASSQSSNSVMTTKHSTSIDKANLLTQFGGTSPKSNTSNIILSTAAMTQNNTIVTTPTITETSNVSITSATIRSGYNSTTPTITASVLIAPDSTPPINGTSDEEKNYELVMSQKYVIEPVKIFNAVIALHLGSGLGYRGTPQNHTENTTTARTFTSSINSPYENNSHPENPKSNQLPRSNTSISAYKILLDGKVKPLTKPPTSTMAPLSWLKGPTPVNIVQIKDSVTTTSKMIPTSTTASSKASVGKVTQSTTTPSKSTHTSVATPVIQELISTPLTLNSLMSSFLTSKPVYTTSIPKINAPSDDVNRTSTSTSQTVLSSKAVQSTLTPRSNATPIILQLTPTPMPQINVTSSSTESSSHTTSTLQSITTASSPINVTSANETITASVNASTSESSTLKNESRQEPAQAKVYDPLMPYPEEYPEEYQTIQNGPAIIITRTTYTRIPDVTYTTVTMATLPTYAQVQKAEENFASTLFERKFGERSYERAGDRSSTNQSYFNIDVKKIEEKPSASKIGKNERKMDQNNDQRFVIVQSQQIPKEDDKVHTLDEKDMKIVENFMNKNLGH